MGSNVANPSPLAALSRRMKKLAAVLSLALSALLPAASSAADKAPARTVDAQEARRLVADGVKVVDVRTPREFEGGHVPGAVNIPYDEIEKRLAEIGPPETKVLLYCQSGRRSGIAAEKLQEKGYTQLYDLRRYDLWTASEPAQGR